MPPPDDRLVEQFPSALSFLGEVLFRWVPASIAAAYGSIEGNESPFSQLGAPVSAWDVPGLLQRTASSDVYQGLAEGWYTFTLISLLVSIPLLALVIYCWIRIMQIRRLERLAWAQAQRTVATQNIPKTQLRWQRVTEQANSSSPESWRLAILEADIMLSELLDLQGYRGETMADKMKRVERGDFNSIDAAWEAHKVRNRIAHEGAAHELSAREVRRVISLYEKVFKEFKYVE